jgi:hypothetical protein
MSGGFGWVPAYFHSAYATQFQNFKSFDLLAILLIDRGELI